MRCEIGDQTDADLRVIPWDDLCRCRATGHPPAADPDARLSAYILRRPPPSPRDVGPRCICARGCVAGQSGPPPTPGSAERSDSPGPRTPRREQRPVLRPADSPDSPAPAAARGPARVLIPVPGGRRCAVRSGAPPARRRRRSAAPAPDPDQDAHRRPGPLRSPAPPHLRPGASGPRCDRSCASAVATCVSPVAGPDPRPPS